jgi:hypothetical protein
MGTSESDDGEYASVNKASMNKYKLVVHILTMNVKKINCNCEPFTPL